MRNSTRGIRTTVLVGAAVAIVGATAAIRWLSKKIPEPKGISELQDAASLPPPSATRPKHDPLAEKLTHADDRVDINHWLPPQWGIAPEVRIGKRWYSTLWLLPIGFVGLLGAIAGAQGLRQTDWCDDFIKNYPGTGPNAPSIDSGFPAWLRWQHFFNLFLMTFILRSGVQILADHPRLYWNAHCTPGTEWFRFQRPVPKDRLWTAKDDSVTLPKWLGIPGLRHSIGLARWWHFSVNLLWVANGVVSYINLFRTDQWRRLVPVSLDVFPNALSTAIQYASLDFPPDKSWTRYNSLQQLTYFITVFVAAPTMIATGLMQSPAISNKTGKLGRIVHRQAARSIHVLSFFWFLFFITSHVTMVFITGLRPNLNHMFAGKE